MSINQWKNEPVSKIMLSEKARTIIKMAVAELRFFVCKRVKMVHMFPMIPMGKSPTAEMVRTMPLVKCVPVALMTSVDVMTSMEEALVLPVVPLSMMRWCSWRFVCKM